MQCARTRYDALIHDAWPDSAYRVRDLIGQHLVGAAADAMNAAIEQEQADVAPDNGLSSGGIYAGFVAGFVAMLHCDLHTSELPPDEARATIEEIREAVDGALTDLGRTFDE
jgi:hypothetical protein